MTGSLCDALTGQDNGQTTVEMLERANLFIVPLDDERQWYRYHHLFANILLQRLRQTQPNQEIKLHSLASGWFEKNEFVDEAIEHAILAEDFEKAAYLIEEQVDAFWGRGEHSKLQSWLLKLPIELILTKPHLGILYAWFQFTTGHLDVAEQTLNTIDLAIDSKTDRTAKTESQEQISITDSDKIKLEGRAAAVRALIVSHQEDVPGIIQYANQALESLPEQDLTWRGLTAITLSDAHYFKGDMTAAYEARIEALKACKAAGDIYFIMVANLNISMILREQGKLQQTVEIYQQQMQLANKRGMSQSSFVAYLLALWGEALAELNDLEGAIDRAKRGFILTERIKNQHMLGWSYICLMRVLLSSGDLAGAEEITQKMKTISSESNFSSVVTNQVAAWQARLWLVQDKLEAASHWAVERGLFIDGEPKLADEIDFRLLSEYIVLARILIAQGRSDQSAELLQHLLEAATAGGRTSRAIEILILQAMSFEAEDDTTQAITALEKALNLAEPGGFIRIFVDEGPPMGSLLYEALKRHISPDYISQLLAAFPGDELEKPDPSIPQTHKAKLVEPLSDREIEVLQLISEGLTNSEIGSRLYLSPNTVKAHARNIYAKIGVNNRTQAGAKARALGLLKNT
jgi:LuxR family maltose regulon positive regulatory protein